MKEKKINILIKFFNIILTYFIATPIFNLCLAINHNDLSPRKIIDKELETLNKIKISKEDQTINRNNKKIDINFYKSGQEKQFLIDTINSEVERVIKNDKWNDFEKIIFIADCIYRLRLSDNIFNALFKNIHKKLNKLLKNYDLNIDQQNSEERTPLMLSIIKNLNKAAKSLIYGNANVNIKDKYGYTALSWAIITNNKQLAKILIQSKADINNKNIFGETPLLDAIKYNHKHLVKLLIKAGADLNIKNNDGMTALMYAAKEGLIKIARILIRHGANVNEKDKYGYTALYWAKTKNHKDLMKLLKKTEIYKVIKMKKLK